jgi:hypothetical protein
MIYVFRIYVSFNSRAGFDIYLTAKDEKSAISKAQNVVKGDEYGIKEVSEKSLWVNMWRSK